jgi:hypothetical protein
MKRIRHFYQPRLRNEHGKIVRRPSGWAALDPRVRDAIERDAIRFSRMVGAEVARSWTINTALAAFYGVDILTPLDIMGNTKRRQVQVVKFPARKRA